MKVLLISDSFLPSLGGVERHTYILSRYLAMHGFKVSVLTEVKTANDNKIMQLGVNVIRELKFLKTNQYLFQIKSTLHYIQESAGLANTIKELSKDFDIIHYHGMHHLFLDHNKLDKRQMLTTIHGIQPSCVLCHRVTNPCKNPSAVRCTLCKVKSSLIHFPLIPIIAPYYHFYYKAMRKSLRSCTVICVSDYVKKIVQSSLKINNLITVHNFIDFEGDIKPELSSLKNFDVKHYLGLPNDSKIITYFGRLDHTKGVDLLIKGFLSNHEKLGKNVYLVIGGNGSQRQQLESMVNSSAPIIFTGMLPRRIQLATMAQSDVFVHPSRYPDACPSAIIEAMALGLPIVATRVGGIPELVVEGKGGHLVNPESPIQLIKGIRNLLIDETFRLQAKTFNFRRSNNFDISHLGPKIIEVYKRALERSIRP